MGTWEDKQEAAGVNRRQYYGRSKCLWIFKGQ
jgi:hypothetical protein